jgi:glycosyltransferase involved in cell wall biosynthesis
MSKKIFCFLNAPYLGGAERSFILQARDLNLFSQERGSSYDFRFVIPYLKQPGEDSSVTNLILESGFSRQQILYYRYSPHLYSIGRGQSHYLKLLYLPWLLWCFLATASHINRLPIGAGDIWWLGGNKVGPLAFVLALVKGFRGRIIWHFRDYLAYTNLFKVFWKLISTFSLAKLEFMGNSYDVSQSIAPFIPRASHCWTLYNPVGTIPYAPTASQKDSGFILATASMFTPWKGLHFLVHFACLFEQELKAMGIKSFFIYGDEIYKTSGNHHGLKKQLSEIIHSFQSDFVQLKGLKPPSDIFSEADFFIHAPIRPEPFGRVLVESYHSGTPLISTGLGGSRELIDDNHSGLLFFPYDYYGLLESVARMCSPERYSFIQEGRLKGVAIENRYKKQLLEIFND